MSETKADAMRMGFLTGREPESHKGDYGHALLVAGSYGKMGAAVLASRACLRSGVGLLTVHVPRCGVEIMQTAVPEAMLSIDEDERRFTSLPADIERYSAIGIGPGLGTDDATVRALLCLLEKKHSQLAPLDIPLVLDADALNILSRHPEALHLASGAVITPHGGEYGRLFGDADPQTMSDMHGLVIVKKSHRTVVYAPGAEPVVNSSGNAGMATGGSGDVLTGLLTGLLAQSLAYPRRNGGAVAGREVVASLAVYVHGRSGDIAAESGAQASLLASDIVDHIASVYREFSADSVSGY